MMINAKRISQPEHFRQFLSQLSDNSEIIIYVNNMLMSRCAANVTDFIGTVLQIAENDDAEIKCVGDDEVVLLLTGYDINWWKQSSRRYNKLYRCMFNEETSIKQKKVVSETQYTVGVATLQEGVLSQIKTFVGNKKDVTKFFNEEITTRYLDEFLKMKVVLNLAYKEGDENDVSQWLTLDELQEMGAIKLYE